MVLGVQKILRTWPSGFPHVVDEYHGETVKLGVNRGGDIFLVRIFRLAQKIVH